MSGTIDEIPMGGLPEPGPAPTEDTGEERTHLTDMPEESEHRDADGAHASTTGISNNKLAMWLFLGSECLLFGGLISTYMLYRARHSGNLGPDQIYDIPFTSVSSFVLLMSSLTMVLAVSSVARGDLRNTKLWLCVTALLGATFVGGQVYEFTTFYREGLGFTTSLFSSSFYTLTGFHGAHVTVGIIMLMSLVLITLRDRLPGSKPEVVGVQIHDGEDDVMQVRLEGQKLMVQYHDGKSEAMLDPNYKLGTPFDVRVVAAGGKVDVLYNGQKKAELPLAGSGWYWKVGAYVQSNGSKGDGASSAGEVVVYKADVKHS